MFVFIYKLMFASRVHSKHPELNLLFKNTFLKTVSAKSMAHYVIICWFKNQGLGFSDGPY